MSVKFKFNRSSSDIIKQLKQQLEEMIDAAKIEIANYLHEELINSSPIDTSTFSGSWMAPEKTKQGYQIINRLPTKYVASGANHVINEPIIAPYNQFILEGEKAGAPISYLLTSNEWEYRNYATGQLQDVSILLWKFSQGALGLNPYTILNRLFVDKVKGKF